jgi:flagellar operon protein
VIEGVRPAGAPAAPPPAVAPPRPQPAGTPFAALLDQRLGATGELRFSGHARERLERRGIEVGGDVLARLDDGVRRAAAKGSRDSLVLVDGTAFVVSVSNRTVVTAVDRGHMREQVFTNIDSAVIA